MPFSASAPSHIFIVRHGARLDMADAQWQLTSPTPYDTPLTYGGWTQSRLVGVRIATLIGNQLSQPSSPPMAARKGEVRRRKKAKKMRVVIHSSPFLRCIQTSVSIAAGIAQHHHQEVTNAHFVAENPVDPTPEDRSKFQFTKPLLRLDSWLGEWLAEDYYVDITPPPPTSLLIGTAKADYIRPSSASGIPAAPVVNASPLYNLSSLTTSLPTTFTGGYVPPSPTWAISNHGKIPTGYVSHAKDYVEFDLGWDSSKLGSGAEYGEEWASMHTRFKSGWKKLLWYYSSEDPKITTFPTRWKRATETSFSETMKKKSSATIVNVTEIDPNTKENTDGNPTPPLSDGEEEVEEKEEDEEIQTVLILVTHGAGCNALIGAITRQPVLIDIGISSLTMAVRRDLDPDPPAYPTNSPKTFHHHSASAPTPGEIPEPPVKYDLKISANTDHLRSGTPLSTPPVSPNLRYGLNSLMPIGNFTLSGSGVGSMSTVFGNNTVRRSASSVGPLGSGNHGGLWSGRSGRESRPSSREEFSPLSLTGPSFASVVGEGSSDDGSSGSVTGLWDASGWERKRRWTVSRSEVPG